MGPLGRRSSRVGRMSTDNLMPDLAHTRHKPSSDPFSYVDDAEQKETREHGAEIPPLVMDRDCPDGFRVEEGVWDRLQDLRRAKILSERAVKKLTTRLNKMKQDADHLSCTHDSLTHEMQELQAEIEHLESKINLSDRNLEVLVELRQGQNELQGESLVTDHSHALLMPTARVEKLNTEIKALGNEKVRILNKIKDFRKSINYLEWEYSYMGKQSKNLEEYHTDILLLRVEKKTLDVMRGGAGEGITAANTEKKLGVIQKAHGEKASKIKAGNAKLVHSVRERRDENERLKNQMKELEKSVKVREQIYKSRVDSTGGEATPAQRATGRMKRVTMRRRLIDLARVQTEEIDYLRQELDRLRQRTFPSFAHAARSRLLIPPDEVV